jgi:2-dehydro-3-deoxy-L-rhamnonate dehydrogenase (NAD+)
MSVLYDFSGQTTIVTGGARGIGRAIATQFLRSGAQVWIWDVDPIKLDGAQSLKVDVTSANDIAKALSHVVSQSPRIDILVNNAGYLGRYQPFEEFEATEWERILRVNLMGVFEVTRQVLPLMRRTGRGRIVNMGSLAGKEGLPNLATYSAASAGVIAFTKALSREVCDADIRVNCVAPGPIDTDLIRRLGDEVVDKAVSSRYSNTTVGLLVMIPYVVALPVMILVSRSSDHSLERRCHAAIPAIIGAFALMLLGATANSSPFFSVMLWCFVASGICSFLAPFYSLPNEFLTGFSAAAGIAFINSFGNLGGFVGPYAMGAITQCQPTTQRKDNDLRPYRAYSLHVFYTFHR